MTNYLSEDFLLHNNAARELYHDYAAGMPIFDYHNHLIPEELATDKKFANLTDIWLGGDHYKWRAMRTNGIPESRITGGDDAKDTFMAWAETVPYCLRNPLYDWTHLELQRYFGINELLNPQSAERIWETANEQLQGDNFSALNLLRGMKVRALCTTDDPIDDLAHHRSLNDCDIRVLPTFRPDKMLTLHDPKNWNAWLDKLGKTIDNEINSYQDLCDALDKRHQYFHDIGCRVADHGLQYPHASEWKDDRVAASFQQARAGIQINEEAAEEVRSALMDFVARLHHKRGWTMQLHIGAIRNNNSRLLETIGADCGVDSIGDDNYAPALSRFLDRLNANDQLAKTILYNLNDRDNGLMATMIGNFQDGVTPGKLQYGAAWWFHDQKLGIIKNLNDLSMLGLLHHAVGMLTDSRSLLSFPRHEYYRRILCQLLGDEMEKGEMPNDMDLVGGMVRDICYYNARNYFGIDIPEK